MMKWWWYCGGVVLKNKQNQRQRHRQRQRQREEEGKKKYKKTTWIIFHHQHVPRTYILKFPTRLFKFGWDICWRLKSFWWSIDVRNIVHNYWRLFTGCRWVASRYRRLSSCEAELTSSILSWRWRCTPEAPSKLLPFPMTSDHPAMDEWLIETAFRCTAKVSSSRLNTTLMLTLMATEHETWTIWFNLATVPSEGKPNTTLMVALMTTSYET